MEFARQGARVCLVDKDADGLATTNRLLQPLGTQTSKHCIDVTMGTQVRQCVGDITQRGNGIDVLVNNAGANAPGLIDEIDEQAWENAMSINLKSVYLFCNACWPHLRKQASSAIVNMSSVMGQVGGSGAPVYCTAKAGIMMLSRCLAKDGARFGIRVNSVCPGYIDTPILRSAGQDDKSFARWKQRVADMQPMGRIGAPEEVAKVVAFLASTDASFVSGTALTVDGAFSATQIDG
jgi:NAD(P)-dependent dehydrogenase (short-subunit alcohol dehydrogenase family)